MKCPKCHKHTILMREPINLIWTINEEGESVEQRPSERTTSAISYFCRNCDYDNENFDAFADNQ